MKYIFSLKEIPEEKEILTGGKAKSLGFMMKNTNIRIPEGYVISAEAVSDKKLNEEAKEELKNLCDRLDKNVTYAVRSSAINEDGKAASFAGQYETVTDVKTEDIFNAVETVILSAENGNVKAYSKQIEYDESAQNGIGIVIQRFVKAEYSGVLFTSDPIDGDEERMTGNYVRGEGEKLVSGSENADVFTINAIKHAYEGPKEFERYAKELGRYAKMIRNLYRCPMDIEWAASKGKVYILQARPITTLGRINMDTYEVNGSLSGKKMLTRTNVGEIFMKPVSPMTFSVLEKINEILGLPEWLDNICGQPYMNISVMCSLAVSFGAKKEKAFETMKGLVGRVPEGTEVPLSPFDKKNFLRRIFRLFFPKQKSKLNKKQKKMMVERLADISREMIEEIRRINSEEELINYWDEKIVPGLRDGMASIIGQSGTSMYPLFSTKSKIAKIAGDEMAERLCGGCLGELESMKPLLLLGDLANGKITREEYIKECGQRCPNEMELMEKHPYEDDEYTQRLIKDFDGNIPDIHKMLENQKESYEEALKEFKEKYPGKKNWIDKKIESFVTANQFREDLRSKGVWIFCVFREYLLCAGRIKGIGDDIFMLTFDELFRYLKGEEGFEERIEKRRKTFEKYRTYETFPGLVLGRFDVEAWMKDDNRRYDVYTGNSDNTANEESDIKGFAGAAGIIKGKVRVITDVEHIGDVCEGDILVTTATNIGWTPVFTKVSAIVTDIGAPLSHAAIVARECGIPAVVGCQNATTKLHTGDEVIVDGSAGTVKLCK